MAKLTVTPGYWLLLAFVYYLGGISWVALWLGAVALHELGHVLVLCAFRIPIFSGRISLSGACLVTGAMAYGQEFWVALAGPVAGLLPLGVFGALPQFATLSLLLSLVNLLPVYPLDGGRCMVCALRLWTSPRCCDVVMTILEWVVGGAMTAWCLWATFLQGVGLWPLFLLFFLGLRMVSAKDSMGKWCL